MPGYPRCHHDGPCFAKEEGKMRGTWNCSILYNTRFPKRKGGTCPFQKPERSVTDDKSYPYNERFGGKRIVD